MSDQSLYSRALFLLSVAHEKNRRDREVIARIEAQYEHERVLREAHIEGLRALVRRQQERIAELGKDKARLDEADRLMITNCHPETGYAQEQKNA